MNLHIKKTVYAFVLLIIAALGVGCKSDRNSAGIISSAGGAGDIIYQAYTTSGSLDGDYESADGTLVYKNVDGTYQVSKTGNGTERFLFVFFKNPGSEHDVPFAREVTIMPVWGGFFKANSHPSDPNPTAARLQGSFNNGQVGFDTDFLDIDQFHPSNYTLNSTAVFFAYEASVPHPDTGDSTPAIIMPIMVEYVEVIDEDGTVRGLQSGEKATFNFYYSAIQTAPLQTI